MSPSELAALPRILTRHAAARYRLRRKREATDDEIIEVLRDGRYQPTIPTWLQAEKVSDGVVMVSGGAFLVADTGTELVALTFIKRPQYAKADKRAHQRQRHSTFT